MMDDILKRLRRWAHSGGCGCIRCTAANEIERLTTEGEVLKAAIATIAGQKLCKEMRHPFDGDYEYAYEEMIRVARIASDAISKEKSHVE